MPTHVLIAGGGVAGVRVAHLLGNYARKERLKVTLVDREPVFTYNQLACALRLKPGMNPHDKAGIPFTRVLDGTGVCFVHASIHRVERNGDTNQWEVVMANGETINTDVLVLTPGAQPRTGIIPGGKQHAFGVHTIHEAAQLRFHIESLFLRHAASSRSVQEEAWTVVVIGGGVTGVETAARLQHFIRALARRFHVDEQIPRVVVCEAESHILRELSVSARKQGSDLLEGIGVSVQTNHQVVRIDAHSVETAANESIRTHTAVWTAGMRTNDVLLRSEFPACQSGLFTDSSLRVRGTENVFAAGSAAPVVSSSKGLVEEGRNTHPDTVPGAIAQANVVAENIPRVLQKQPLVMYQPTVRPYYPSPPFSGLYTGTPLDIWVLSSVLPNMSAYRLWRKGVTVR